MISRPVVKLSYVVHVSQCTRQTQLPVQEPLYTKMLDGHCTVYSVQYTMYTFMFVHVHLGSCDTSSYACDKWKQANASSILNENLFVPSLEKT